MTEMVTNDALYILFNDHKKKADITDPRQAKKVWLMPDTVSILETINLSNGTVTKRPLFRFRKY
jgi:hypothetical protein